MRAGVQVNEGGKVMGNCGNKGVTEGQRGAH